MVKIILANRATTLAGIGIILVALGSVIQHLINEINLDYNILISELISDIVLIFACNALTLSKDSGL